MGRASRVRAVFAFTLAFGGACGKVDSGVDDLHAAPEDADSTRPPSAPATTRPHLEPPWDATLHPPIVDATAAVPDASGPGPSSDASFPDSADAPAEAPSPTADAGVDAIADAAAESHCLDLERSILDERTQIASCTWDADCTALYDGLCATTGQLLGAVGCFLPANTTSDVSALEALEAEYVADCHGQPGTCDCNALPPTTCVRGTCVANGTCSASTRSTIPGTRIEFPPQPCVFTLAEAAAGITIQYRIVVDEPVSGLEIPVLPCTCNVPIREYVSGNGQWYCACDFGCCDQPPGVEYPLVPGTYDHTFTWVAVTWNGPSDTGEPYGPPFPPGTYGVTATLDLVRNDDAGTAAVGAVGVFAVTLVP